MGGQLLKTELSLSDEWETPQELYDYLCKKYKIKPELDVAANRTNTKCLAWSELAFDIHWCRDVWCNPPHSKNEAFVRKAFNEWDKHNINIMMILPANSLCTNYAEDYILPYAKYHPINRKYCNFLHKGESKDHSRNGYFVVIWRKRNA